MIDRMFIQEEKTTLALDKQLAKEKPGERGGGERGTRGVPHSQPGPRIRLRGAGAWPHPPAPLGGARAPLPCSSLSSHLCKLTSPPFHRLDPGMEETCCHSPGDGKAREQSQD